MKKTTLADQTAASKAMEHMFSPEERLFEDEYSVKFISAFNRPFISMLQSKRLLHWMADLSEKIAPGVYGGLIARTRYIDDVIDKALGEGMETIVNLGGGYDTRCLRIGRMKEIDYYHVDQAEVIDKFSKNMAKLPMGIPDNVRFVSIDFDKQSLAEVLSNSGYDKRSKTLFIWEAVTQYISEEAVSDTLK
ncbi:MULTISPECIES: class I SAM-dependent methyltransferase [unclassified Fusibacter]|uniref:class I SAM-dependent methyltransferase n=1 Tax=unclassified Fusibacter TaxID=2624464 RepID=UPI0010120A31|nr:MULTISPECIES: class I SAM-dependent methyltransferase [unclassified Fusibacter]MCK8058966.1 class I SAM-dependent methyltransferase [Fusibacter sp. A2]NPE22043.1 class I SAM-dependent methyltransferase [Fusibacter sp. A1]RXV61607.1 SAM-dependent methyltransferase [Fusibacter sp. A1]